MQITKEQWDRLSAEADTIVTKEKIEPVLECPKCKGETSFRLMLMDGKDNNPELFRLMYWCFNCKMWETIVWQREPPEGMDY